ncbi:MAG: DOMON-like domain-containing protein [Sphingomicrobium sp.]
MQFDLLSHPAMPPSEPFKLWAKVDYAGKFGASATCNIWYGIDLPLGRFNIPQSGDPHRANELWTTTCFEAFVQAEGEATYREFNFAPSGDWAAYDFSERREGMAEAELANSPYIRLEDNLTWWCLGATFALEAGRRWALGLSAVIEELDGTKSYWALAHGGDQPDFHDPACFTARLG